MTRLFPAALHIILFFCALIIAQPGLCAGSSLVVTITNNSSLALIFNYVEQEGHWDQGLAMHPGEILQPKSEMKCRLINPNGRAELIFMVGSPDPDLDFAYGFKAAFNTGGKPVATYRTQIEPDPPQLLDVVVSEAGAGPEGGEIKITFE